MEKIKSHLNDYEVFDSIGSGSYGLVYKGKSYLDNKDVAIKCFTIGNNLFKNYLNELKFVFTLSHPNIVKVIDVCSVGIHHYIIYEYMNAGSLRDQINNKEIKKVKDAIAIINSISLALAHVHKNNVAHRDIKPENILISGENDNLIYKLADFGVSKISTGDSDLTTNIGSPAYMSPEQFKALYDKRSDIYSLGIIFYEMLYGKRPFSGSLSDIMNGHLYEEPDFENMDIDLIKVLKKMLEKNPDFRYQNAFDIVEDILKINIEENYATKMSNINIFNIELPGDYNQVEEISSNEKVLQRNLGSHIRFFENNHRDHAVVISSRNAFIYSDKLDIESYVDEKDIDYIFKTSHTIFVKDNSIFRLEKVSESFEKIKIFEFKNIAKNFYNSSEDKIIIYSDIKGQINLYNYAKNQMEITFESGLTSIIQICLKNNYIYIISNESEKYKLNVYDLAGLLVSTTKIDNFIQLNEDEKYVYAISYDQSECKIYKFYEKSHDIYCFNFYQLKDIDVIDGKIFIINHENIIFLIEENIIHIGKNINIGQIMKFRILKNLDNFLFIYKQRNSLKLTLIPYDTLFD